MHLSGGFRIAEPDEISISPGARPGRVFVSSESRSTNGAPVSRKNVGRSQVSLDRFKGRRVTFSSIADLPRHGHNGCSGSGEAVTAVATAPRQATFPIPYKTYDSIMRSNWGRRAPFLPMLAEQRDSPFLPVPVGRGHEIRYSAFYPYNPPPDAPSQGSSNPRSCERLGVPIDPKPRCLASTLLPSSGVCLL